MTEQSTFPKEQIISTTTRTLLAAGYVITGSRRQPEHIEFECERISRLGANIKFLVAVTDGPELQSEQAEDVRYTAKNEERIPILVSRVGTSGQITFTEFLDALGGAVPSWRALTTDFSRHLETASRNKLPDGMTGEAWWIFESLVADALEFCFSRRVNRLGGQKRGKTVSDVVAPLPNFSVVVVDAKASLAGFDANWPSLRPLVEYVERQKIRQRGGGDVIAALVVSSSFCQDESGLADLAKTFLGTTRVPLCFMTAGTLGQFVDEMRKRPDIRNSIRWKMLLSSGLIRIRHLEAELNSAAEERCDAREF